jgi:tetratricopeptide (TPR) repeat protein
MIRAIVPAETVMTQRERTLRRRYQQSITRHRRAASAASWFALGDLIAEAEAISAALATELADEVGDAITCWRKCVRMAPAHADAWHRLALAYQEQGDRAGAERALKRVVKLAPKNAAAWNRLAVVTMPAAGEDDPARLRRAEKYLRRAIEEDPRGKKLGWEPYAWLAEAAERLRDDPGAVAWYAEANRRGDRYAGARKQVIEGHGARRRAKGPRPALPASRSTARR